MELLWVVLVLLFIATPVMAIVALANISSLRRDIEKLRREVSFLSEGSPEIGIKLQTVKQVTDAP